LTKGNVHGQQLGFRTLELAQSPDVAAGPEIGQLPTIPVAAGVAYCAAAG